MTPTQRCLADLRKIGATAAIVEKWNPHARIRQDLFGCIDILAILPRSLVGIQVTSGTNHAARRAKILSEPRAQAWIEAGGLIELWSYAKAGARGKRKLWTCRKEEITLSDFHWDACTETKETA